MERFKVKVYLQDKKAFINGEEQHFSRCAFVMATHREPYKTARTGEVFYKYYGRFVDGSDWTLGSIDAFISPYQVVTTGKPLVLEKPFKFVPAHVFSTMEREDIQAEKLRKANKKKSKRSPYPEELNRF